MTHRAIRALALAGATWLPFATALATVPAPEPEDLSPAEWEAWLDGGSGHRAPPPSLGPFNYVHEFDQMVSFLATWQLLDPDSTDYGGMIEAESGSLRGVIQTDNTLEAIWCWSRYREFSGRTTYDPNVTAAWIYCQNFPAWMEEGGAADDYYRVHNCAWGLMAVLQYEAATGDGSFDAYAESCAQYIASHSLVINDGTIWQQRLDSFVKGWAAGNLYLYGEARGDAAFMDAAVLQGLDVYQWLNANPATNLTLEYWAMSSGTALWGVCNSVFRDDPVLGMGWIATNGGFTDTWQDWMNIPGFDWDSAWNVGFCNGHFAAFDVSGDPTYFANGGAITDNLLSLDTDDDGGITAESVDLDTEDMSWVTCYLVAFGVNRMMGTPLAHDTGVLAFSDLRDGDAIPLGQPIPIIARATNYGLSDEVSVEVHFEGDAGTGVVMQDLAFAALDDVTFSSGWIPPATGSYTVTAYTMLPGDGVAANDTARVTFDVVPPIGVPGADDAFTGSPHVRSNPFRSHATFVVPNAAGQPVALTILDPSGRVVFRRDAIPSGSGPFTVVWDGRDTNARTVAPGVYFYRLRSATQRTGGTLVRLD